jgi:hypothetical protein
MAMANTTYQGRLLEDGRFIPDSVRVKIPVPCRVVVSISEEEMEAAEPAANTSAHHRQAAAVKKFLASVAALEDEDDVMTEADWDEMANLRAGTNAGFARKIEL